MVNKYISSEYIDKLVTNEYFGLPKDFDEDNLYNILLDASYGRFFDNPVSELLDIMSNPDYFYYTCKWLLNVNILPFQGAILKELWRRKFPMLIGTRGLSKTWILALYALLRAIFTQGSKIILVGAVFRQSKLIFEYIENFWRNSPILRNIVGSGHRQGPKRDIDRCNFYIGESEIIAIPVGTGETIRGLRANYTICDEFSALSRDIFEVVIKGFSAVSSGPAEKARNMAKVRVLRSLGMDKEAGNLEDDIGFGNQTVISGTAYYSFNHFCEYFDRYKRIIQSCGDTKKLEDIFQGSIPEDFNWRDFSIFRIPVDLLPHGFMDMAQISQAKVMSHSSTYQMEYGAIFPRDSDGFFKRTLIESCVTNQPIEFPNSGNVKFSATINGRPNCKYVYGIDPASEKDNFAIVILEVYPDHRRIVYSWTINRQRLRERMRGTLKSSDKSFYNICARKIRDLMKTFPTDHIGIDGQGGGISIIEALHDKDELQDNEVQIWPYIKRGEDDTFFWEDLDKPTDGEPGAHILHVVQFANQHFTEECHHGLRKDFESRITLFPFFDPVTVSEAISIDKLIGREYDTLEDTVMEIEELKDELATIVHTQSSGGRDKWDTPEIKLPGNKKGRLRKDRCTALLIANIVARSITLSEKSNKIEYVFSGGYKGQARQNFGTDSRMYYGPDYLTQKMDGSFYRGINRSGV